MTTLLVPDVRRGHGTGHLRRCVALARTIDDSLILVPAASDDTRRGRGELADLLSGLPDTQIVENVPSDSAKIVIDCFQMGRDEILSFGQAFTVGIDLGGEARHYCSCLIDTLPRLNSAPANLSDTAYLDLPDYVPMSEGSAGKVLVTFGGEDPASLTESTARALVETAGVSAMDILVVEPGLRTLGTLPPGVRTIAPVPSLEPLFAGVEWVVTSFGLTALEARAFGRRVITVAPTPYHDRLARETGFARAGVRRPSSGALRSLVRIQASGREPPPLEARAERKSLGALINKLPPAQSGCPAHHEARGRAVWRGREKSYFRCPVCTMTYMERFAADQESYSPSYFDTEYKTQYGRTYLEDFPAIKRAGERRVTEIKSLLPDARTVLDVGCAYGPFMAAAADAGLEAFGVDVSSVAVEHVRSVLNLHASVGSVPGFSAEKAFGRTVFDAVALWYVIEHFGDLDAVMRALSTWVKPGGVLALGTPFLSGVSGRLNRNAFFEQSPRDHFTIWSRRSARILLEQYGFRVRRIVSTGHHPERYPAVRRGKLPQSVAAVHSRLFGWGDTFEIYAQRAGSG